MVRSGHSGRYPIDGYFYARHLEGKEVRRPNRCVGGVESRSECRSCASRWAAEQASHHTLSLDRTRRISKNSAEISPFADKENHQRHVGRGIGATRRLRAPAPVRLCAGLVSAPRPKQSSEPILALGRFRFVGLTLTPTAGKIHDPGESQRRILPPDGSSITHRGSTSAPWPDV